MQAILNLMRHSVGNQRNCLSKAEEFVDLHLELQTGAPEQQRSAHVEDWQRFWMTHQKEQSCCSRVVSRQVHMQWRSFR